ncbi:MAG: hypothetical protein KDJ36_19595, partial [Hyphomicrobiaceae bacterium]|nr:hypothetical protein [Hyphomicrobiaceae bacterium]
YYAARNVSAGLFHEHGYTWTGNLVFDEARYGADAEPVNLGDVSLRGRAFTTGVFLAVHY